jgi:hypothetical protein
MGIVKNRIHYQNALAREDFTVTNVGYGGDTSMFYDYRTATSYEIEDYDWVILRVEATTAAQVVNQISVIIDKFEDSLVNEILRIQITDDANTILEDHTYDPFDQSIISFEINPLSIIPGTPYKIWLRNEAERPITVRQVFLGLAVDVTVLDSFQNSATYQGTKPFKLQGSVTYNNKSSINGSFIGKLAKNELISTTIAQEYLDEDWTWNVWDNIQSNLIRHPFFFLQNYIETPDNIAYCIAENIERPTNTGPANYMSIDIKATAINNKT